MFFDAKEYATAARILDGLVEEVPEQTGPRLAAGPLLLPLGPTAARRDGVCTIVERDPVEHYARLMLGRTLERQGRDAEAAPHLRMAAALAGDFPQE